MKESGLGLAGNFSYTFAFSCADLYLTTFKSIDKNPVAPFYRDAVHAFC